MCVWSETAVRDRIAVPMLLPKSGESMVAAMFIEPRLQEMSLPTWAYDRSSLYVEAVETCRISEHRLEWVILPLIGFARFTVSSNMMYGYPDSNCTSARIWKNSRALIFFFLIRPSSTSSWYFSLTLISANGTPRSEERRVGQERAA